MRDANADIQDLQLTWNRLEPIPGIVAVHLYYNLYVTMLNLWRDVKNRPITTTIHTSTPLYPQLVLEVAPQIDRPPTRRLTPSMAALILYSMLYKYLIDEPAFWTVTLRTRDATIDVATFHTKYRLGAIPIASGGPSSTTSSAFAGASDVSDKPGTASDVVSNSRITVHVGFQGHLPGPNPRTTWLMCFRKWSFRLLFDKASTDYVVTYADGVIHRILVKPRDDLRVAVESYEMAPPSGARKLTCEFPLPSNLFHLERIKCFEKVSASDACLLAHIERLHDAILTPDICRR